MARFCPLFSGSSGNCLYIGTGNGGILVDAGVSARRIEKALVDREIDPRTIRGIFVTHEHADHTAGLRVFCKRYGTAVYASAGTRQALLEDGTVADCRLWNEADLGDMTIAAFHTAHDSRESTGFCVQLSDDRRVGVATDLGVMTDEVRQALRGCDLIHIESNHDVRMLENGPYPYPLKRRILSDRGHLSNEACAAELPALISAGTTRVSLGHLSRENNLPMLAHATAIAGLTAAGARESADYLLWVAPPENNGAVCIF